MSTSSKGRPRKGVESGPRRVQGTTRPPSPSQVEFPKSVFTRVNFNRFAAGLLLGLLLVVGVVGLVLAQFNLRVTRNQTVYAEDGVAISYNLYEPQDLFGGADLRPGVIVGHGFSANKEAMEGIAVELARAGFVVVALDFRGHGYSSGRLTGDDATLVRDIAAVKGVLVDRGDVLASQLGIVGYSMGGGAAFEACARDPAFKAMVGVAPSPKSVNATNPPNLLVEVGRFDEAFDPEGYKPLLANRTGLPVDQVSFNTDYGSFLDGSATRVEVKPNVDHLTVIWDAAVQGEVAEWLAVALDAYPGARTPITTTRAALTLTGFLAALGILLLSVKPLFGTRETPGAPAGIPAGDPAGQGAAGNGTPTWKGKAREEGKARKKQRDQTTRGDPGTRAPVSPWLDLVTKQARQTGQAVQAGTAGQAGAAGPAGPTSSTGLDLPRIAGRRLVKWYYLYSLVFLVPGVLLAAPLVLLPPTFLALFLGLFLANFLAIAFIFWKKTDLPLKHVFQATFRAPGRTYLGAVVVAVAAYLVTYAFIGTRYLGLGPGVYRWAYLPLALPLLLVTSTLDGAFHFGLRAVDQPGRPRDQARLAAEFFALKGGFWCVVILGFCVLTWNFFLAIFLIVALPIMALQAVLAAVTSRHAGTWLPVVVGAAIFLSLVILSVSPLIDILAMGRIPGVTPH